MQLISVPIVATSLIAGVALTGCGKKSGGNKPAPPPSGCASHKDQKSCGDDKPCAWSNDACGNKPAPKPKTSPDVQDKSTCVFKPG